MDRVALAVVCLLLVGGLAWGQDSLKTKEGLSLRPLVAPDTLSSKEAFQRIAKAWEEGKAETLATFLGDGKITISLSRVAGGVLSKDQAVYVLRDMFKFSSTEKFEFVKFDEFVSEGVVGTAEWSTRSAKGGPVTKDKVSVWLVREGKEKPKWAIREIKEAGK